MKRIFTFSSVFLFGAVFSASTWAACGGGGYKAQQQPSSRTEVQSQAPTASSSTPRTEERQSSGTQQTTSSTLDTRHFNALSGRLGMDYRQAADVISAMREIRNNESNGRKDYDAKMEFEKRLSQILTPKQYQTYQAAS